MGKYTLLIFHNPKLFSVCTVSFLPLSETAFILTSNRDESIVRDVAMFPYRENGLLFPRDGKAGGTWIVSSKQGLTLCLLNGGFEKHSSNPPYRISRGKVVLSVFDYADFPTFANEYNLDGVEDFTLVMVDHQDKTKLYELRWNGKTKFFKQLDPSQTHLWCSATLYPKEVAEKRTTWFKEWTAENEFTLDGIRKFHEFGTKGNDLKINLKNILKTISITSIVKNEDQHFMKYFDIIADTTMEETILKPRKL